MRSLAGAHTTALVGRTHSIAAHAIRITLRNGTVKYITDAQQDVVISGNTYEALAGVAVASIVVRANTGPTRVDLQFTARPAGYIDFDQVRDGVYDGAQVLISAIDESSPSSTSAKFFGVFGNIQLTDRFMVTVECLGILAKSQSVIIDKYGPACLWFFGDENCKYDLSLVEWGGSIVSSVSGRTIVTSGAPQADDFFNLGHLQFTTGLRTGQEWEIRDWTLSTQTLELYTDIEGGVVAGDTFTMWAGCSYIRDDAVRGCLAYGNVINFGGFDTLPGQDVFGQSFIVS